MSARWAATSRSCRASCRSPRSARWQRFAEFSGAALPDEVVARLTAVADDPKAVRHVGVEIATELSLAVLDEGAPGLHFYTQNRSLATRSILQRVRAARA